MEFERRKEFVNRITLALLLTTILATVINIATALSNISSYPFLILGLDALNISVYVAAYWLARQSNPARKKWLQRAANLTVFSTLLYISLLQGVGSSLRIAYFLIPLLVVMTDLRKPLAQIVIALSGLLLTGAIFIQENPASIGFVLIDWLLAYAILSWGTLVYAGRLAQANKIAEERSDSLGQLLNLLKSSTEVGFSLSRELSSVTNELNVSSRQQATSSQEQVAAVTQVTSSLEELSETAAQIAVSSSAAAQSAQRVVEVAENVKQGRQAAEFATDEGNEAVAKTIESVGNVRNRIELLGQRLLNLTEQTRRVGNIIDIIDEIADETHLLALNASIEAAGNIGGGTGEEALVVMEQRGARGNSLRGERFGVIAQEIKNLADRSRESTEEVRQAITEMQGAVAAAVLVAEEGKKATVDALLRAEIAGAVINRLNDMTEASATSVDDILIASEEVKLRCDEISVATGQQRSANQQILTTMRSISEVARHSASLVTELSDKAVKVSIQTSELNNVLAKSSKLGMEPANLAGAVG